MLYVGFRMAAGTKNALVVKLLSEGDRGLCRYVAGSVRVSISENRTNVDHLGLYHTGWTERVRSSGSTHYLSDLAAEWGFIFGSFFSRPRIWTSAWYLHLKKSQLDMSYLPKETLCFWSLFNISGRKWAFREKRWISLTTGHVIFTEGNLMLLITFQHFWQEMNISRKTVNFCHNWTSQYLIKKWWCPQPAGKLNCTIIGEVTDELGFAPMIPGRWLTLITVHLL